jgi:hypothetical protein
VYPSIDAFAAAIAAYTGPEQVMLDGTEVKAGTTPPVLYQSNADGSVTMITVFSKKK